MRIPFYYFIPKSILSRCGAELNAIPWNPQELFHNRAACEFVESDLFRLLIIDATAFMVWPYMGFGEYMEIYSGYDPAWRFAHCPDYWIQELTDEGILASAGELFKGCHSELGYVPEWQIDIYLRYIVPNVMKKHRMDEIIQVAREYPCFEDFDFRKSNQKTDFIRQWYHTRTKHPIISLEEFQEVYADAHGGQEYEEPDPSQNVEETVVAQALVDQFKATLSEKDMQILELRVKPISAWTTALRAATISETDSASQVKRYIRLTYLISEFLEKMDRNEIALSVGVELSFLDESSQREVLEQCAINDCTPSYSQAWRMHKTDREGALTKAVIQAIMSEEKANQKARLKIPMERIRKYFPQGYTAAQIEDAVVKLCERDYRRRTDRER